MSQADREYNRLLTVVMDHGRVKKNRTGIDTIGVFGAQARFQLATFPLLTTKKMFTKGIVHELLWFIGGDTNIKYLVDNGVNIWNANAFDLYRKKNAGKDTVYTNEEDYIEAIRRADLRNDDDHTFVSAAGDLGMGTYGGMWRDFPFHVDRKASVQGSAGNPFDSVETGSVDQLQKILSKLVSSPDDRRLIVSAWHPYWVDHCALPPCHVLFHFNTEELTLEERAKILVSDQRIGGQDALSQPITVTETPQQDVARLLDECGIPKRRLNCLLYQRSCDLFLGVPFNIASYALLTSMIAQVVNMVPGEFIHTYGDLHIYSNHLDQVREQLSRAPFPSPVLKLNPSIKSLFDFGYSDIQFENYKSHPAIKAEMAV